MQNFKDLETNFRCTAESAKYILHQMLTTIETGKPIASDEIQYFQDTISALNQNYYAIVSEAKSILQTDELPADGSPVDAYSAAYETSYSMQLRKKIAQETALLKLFLNVQSHVNLYAEALHPYQEKAAALFEQLQNIEQISELSESDAELLEAHSMFLQAIQNPPDETDGSISAFEILMEKLSAYYPSRRVQNGLWQKLYFIPEIADHMSDSMSQSDAEADTLSADQDNTPTFFESKTNYSSDTEDADQTNTPLTWSDLGIQNAEKLTVQISAESICKNAVPKADSIITAKEFRNDCLKYRFLKFPIRFTFSNPFCTTEILEKLLPHSISVAQAQKEFQFALERGYICSYTLNGQGTVYELSNRTKQLLKRKSVLEILELNAKKYNFKPVSLNDNANTVFVHLMCGRLFNRIVTMIGKDKINTMKILPHCHDFRIIIADFYGDNHELYCAGIVGDCPEQFDAFLSALKETLRPATPLLLIGISQEHGKALAEWIASKIPSMQENALLYYMDDATGSLYRFGDDTEISTDTFRQHPLSTDTTQSDIEMEETSTVPDEVPQLIDAEEPSTVPGEAPQLIDAEEPSDHNVQQNKIIDTPEALNTKKIEQKQKSAICTNEAYDLFLQQTMEMISVGKPYCATAYAYAFSQKYSIAENFYKQLAYACNDPLGNCSYSSDMLFSIFFNESNRISEYLLLSAVLRNYFSDQCTFDYKMQQLHDSISNYQVYTENAALRDVVYRFMEFKNQYHHGVDCYADYRQKDQMQAEEKLQEIQREAKNLYETYIETKPSETAAQKRVLETKKLLFDKKGDLAECLNIVVVDKGDLLELIQTYLKENLIKDDCLPYADNIDPQKIAALIDDNWEKAGKRIRLEKKSSDLMGRLRNNIYMAIQKIAGVMCKYVTLRSEFSEYKDSDASIAYRKNRSAILKSIQEAIQFYEKSVNYDLAHRSGTAILCRTLRELRSRMEGDFEEDSKQYFYLPFLKNQWVLLDSNYLPVLDEVYEIPELSIFKRIQRHAEESEIELEVRLQNIINGDGGDDDYGSAKLIVQYFDTHHIQLSDPKLMDYEKGVSYPKDDAANKRNEFMEDLELAQAYGQIDNTKENMKESFIQIMDIWYDWACKNHYYGFFDKILKGIKNRIKSDAVARADVLRKNLAAFEKTHPNCESDELICKTVKKVNDCISEDNYAAAEDLLNRLHSNQLEINENLNEKDYLKEFLDEYHNNAQMVGVQKYTLQHSFKVHNKETKGGMRLISNWPNMRNTPPEKITALFLALGFAVETITSDLAINGKDNYIVTLKKPVNGRKSNYTHPIYAFGSEAEEKGFRIVADFGKMNAEQLIDTMRQIGNAKHTIILLDYSLSLADRRELARKIKTTNFGKVFLVIDRIVLVYLAKHYSETAVNRMLMAVTMPYADYQPYIYDSGHIMPQEIFMGRRSELRDIESSDGIHIIYGGRQLGKSALLHMAKKDIDHNENGDRAVLVDLKGLNYHEAAMKISEALYLDGIITEEIRTSDWNELAHIIKKRLSDKNTETYIPYFLLLLDEADVFIESSGVKGVNYQPFDALKDILSIGEGRFKFVVAGLRNTMRFQKEIALGNNSVLTHLRSMTIMPFKSTEARELLEIPLSYLGFRFDNDLKTEMLISTIFGTTNYFPGLLQLYCAKLIETLQNSYAGYDESETPPYIVKEAQIKKALADSTLEQHIRDKFFITLKVGDDDYYYLIALLAAYHYHNNTWQNGCSAEDIAELASDYEIEKIEKLSTDQIEALMEEMRELNVLQQIEQHRYRFARHSFCQMMGNTQEIDDAILQYATKNGG